MADRVTEPRQRKTLRIPKDLLAEVERIAETQDRDLTAQVVRFLRDGCRAAGGGAE